MPRKYTPGRRRVSIYVAWSYPAEANRDVTVLDNRFSTMTEVRRVAWPQYEAPPYGDPLMFSQGIAGSLELFFRAWDAVPEMRRRIHRHPVPVFQRVDQAGYRLPLDERVLDDADTLLVFGLDHMVTKQEAAPEEIEAVGISSRARAPAFFSGRITMSASRDDLKERAMEYAHHGDALVPRQQRFGKYTRSLMKGSDTGREPLRPSPRDGRGNKENRAALHRSRPRHARLAQWRDAFNFHMHLPHYAVTADDGRGQGSGDSSRSTCPGRIRSPRRATANSTPASGFRPAAIAPATS